MTLGLPDRETLDGNAPLTFLGDCLNGKALTAANSNRNTVTHTLLARWLALCGIFLVAATWPLWWQTSGFPKIPLLAVWAAGTTFVDRCLLSLLLTAWMACMVWPSPSRPGRVAAGVSVVALALLILADQHRLQPWALQFVLLGSLLTLNDARQTLQVWRWLIVGIYFHSALSKADASFLSTYGQSFLEVLADWLHWNVGLWSTEKRRWLAAFFPAGEFLAALLLAVGPRRFWWLAVSLGMHVLLLGILGPLGMQHSLGVLLWNVFFIGQNVLLFRQLRTPAETRTGRLSSGANPLGFPSLREKFTATAVLAVGVGLPCLAPWDYWDVWPSWAVYASSPAGCEIEVDSTAVSDLPEKLQAFVKPTVRQGDSTTAVWSSIDVSAWALAERDAPAYPEPRYRLAVARWLIEQGVSAKKLRLRLWQPADRLNTNREIETLPATQINRISKRYWLNTFPQ